MGKYTVFNGDIDLKIQEQLDLIIDFLKRCFEEIESIVLVGGFGRGEGIVNIETDHITILSDYDLYIILNDQNKLSLQQLETSVRNFISKSNPLSEINGKDRITLDLHFLHRDLLKKLPPRLRFFDLKYGSKVIDGEDLLHLIPDFRTEGLPLYEGVRLLLNRLYYTAEWFSLSYVADKKNEDIIKHTLLKEASKNYLVSCFALSILSSSYDPSALKSSEKLDENYIQSFPLLAEVHPDLAGTIRLFVRQGLESRLYSDSHLDTWLRSLTDLFAATEFYQKEFVGMDKWEEFHSKTCKHHLNPYLKYFVKKKFNINLSPKVLTIISVAAQAAQRLNWFRKILEDNKKIYWKILSDYRDPAISIYSAFLFLFLSIKKDGSLNQELYGFAQNYIRSIYPGEPANINSGDVEKFRKTLEDCIYAYDLNFGKGPTIEKGRVRVIIRVMN